MPGYNTNRFNSFENMGIDLEEFMCGICHGIFVTPVVTDCCQQTYCSDCINQWLNQSNTCPNDRKELRKEELRPMPRAFVNLLENLKIKCDYESEGCEQSVKISALKQHIISCDFRPNINCKTCGLIREIASKHNCIQSLLNEKKDLMEKKLNETKDNEIIKQNYETKIFVLKTKFQEILTFDKEMDKIRQNKAQEFIDLTNESNSWTQPEIKPNIDFDYQKTVIIEARNELDNYLIKRRTSRIPETLFLFMVEKSKEAIVMKDEFKYLCRYLYNQLKKNSEFGKLVWLIFVNGKGDKSCDLFYDPHINQLWIQFQSLDLIISYFKEI